MRPDRVLIFAYNLDRGSLSSVNDKLYASGPSRAPACHLCALISSPVGMKKSWKRFIADLEIPAEYLYREEFSKEYGVPGFSPPGAFIRLGGSLILLAGPDEINRCGTTDDLIGLMHQRIQKYL